MIDFAKGVVACIFSLCIIACKFRLANEPTPLIYKSISESKSNGAFVKELKSQERFFLLDGKKYFIDEAWIEHPYLQKNFYDQIVKGVFCFVVTCHCEKIKPINFELDDYINGIGTGDMRTWFYLEKLQDTVTVHYREFKGSFKEDKSMNFY